MVCSESVAYEFTKEKNLLDQYYRLREKMYRYVFKTEKFIGDEDNYDKISHILIARRGRLCVGGCRLTIIEKNEVFPLPMETADFQLRNAFFDYPLNKLRHAEISRFAVMDEDKDKFEIMRTLSQLIIEKCINSEVAYVFIKTSLPMARNWRRIGKIYCNLNKVRICTDLNVPKIPIHPDVTWYITIFSLPAAESFSSLQKDLD